MHWIIQNSGLLYNISSPTVQIKPFETPAPQGTLDVPGRHGGVTLMGRMLKVTAQSGVSRLAHLEVVRVREVRVSGRHVEISADDELPGETLHEPANCSVPPSPARRERKRERRRSKIMEGELHRLTRCSADSSTMCRVRISCNTLVTSTLACSP